MFTIDNFKNENNFVNNQAVNQGSIASTTLTSVNSHHHHIKTKQPTPVVVAKHDCNYSYVDSDVHQYLTSQHGASNHQHLKYDCINLSFLASASPSVAAHPKYANINDSCYFSKASCFEHKGNTQGAIPILPSQSKMVQQPTKSMMDMSIDDVVDDELDDAFDTKLHFITFNKNNLERDLNLIDQLILLN